MKIVCPSCGEVLEVEKKDRLYCKHCGISFSLEDGEKALDRTFALYKNKAYKYFLKNDYENSNQYYLEALSLKENDLVVISKYSLNLLYGQTLDNTKFKDVIDFIDTHEVVLDSDNTYEFLSFIRSFLSQINLYLNEKERLKKDETFLSLDYFNSYIKSIHDILDALKYFKEVFPLLKEEDYKRYLEDNDNLENKITSMEIKLNNLLLDTYNVNEIGDVKFDEENLVYLNTNIKKIEEKEISDLRVIIPNEKFRFYNKLLYIGGGSLAIIAIIIAIIGIALKNTTITYIAFIPVGLLVILAIYLINVMKKENSKNISNKSNEE